MTEKLALLLTTTVRLCGWLVMNGTELVGVVALAGSELTEEPIAFVARTT